MEQKNKTNNLRNYLYQAFGYILLITAVLLISVMTLGIIYLVNKATGLLIALAILLPLLIIAILVYVLLTFKRVYNVFYANLFETTKRNYRSIYNEKRTLEKYAENDIEEFKDLNNELSKIDAFNENVTVINKYLDYSHIPLEYLKNNSNLITEKSLRNYIKEIINCSQVFRNGLFSINYDIKRELSDSEINEIVMKINNILLQDGILVGLFENKKGFYVYAPRIDSFSLLKQDIDLLFKALTLTDKTIEGISILTARICAVVYPYSDISNLFSDLEYAGRQGKEIFIHLPEKNVQTKGNKLLHSTQNLNTMNRIICDLTEKTKNSKDLNTFLKSLSETFNKISSYLRIDESGVILFDSNDNAYSPKFIVSQNEEAPIFTLNETVEKELIEQIKLSADRDGSYYFSNRKKIDYKLGRILDKRSVGSGFIYYLGDKSENVLGVVYFLNRRPKEIIFDTYIRESLLTLASLTMFSINSAISGMKADNYVLREENLLKASSLYQYTINKKSYDIVSFSNSCKQIIPSIKVGEKCYKTFFGLEKPCKNCPMLVKNKVIKTFNGVDYQVSHSINNQINNNAEFILKTIKGKEELTNRFDSETGLISIYGFLERIKSLYLTKSKGYVITMTIDNAPELTKGLGNEGYSMLLRLFANEVVREVLKDEEIYLYKNNTLVIIIPEIGKIDVLDTVESIYNLSKKDYMKEDLVLSFGYTAIKFPQEFTHSEDLIRHIERVLNGRDINKVKTDYIYLEEDGFIRPASRKDYILAITDDAVKTDKLIIKMQPFISGIDNKIFGSEILIRLTDVERDAMLNTTELVRVAAENDKLNIISDKLLNYVGDAYSKYGAALFRQNGITRMNINADYNYFTQKDFIQKISDVLIKNKVQKDFLAFEITEKELAQHYMDFAPVIRELKRLNVDLICDAYTGASLSLNQIVELGIKEIKTSMEICIDIDISTEKLNTVKKLIESARSVGIRPTLLGIENSQQYNLIKEFSKDINMQGYYFYHPMDLTEFTNSIKQNLE